MKKILLIGLLMQTFTGSAQTRSTDSLLLVQQYLLDIRKAVTVQKWEGEKQFQLITALLEKAYVLEKRFPYLIHNNPSVNKQMKSELNTTFRHILFTLALYKADMKENGLKRPTNQDDYTYLMQKTTEISRTIQRMRDRERNR
jgi:hypothetical protein